MCPILFQSKMMLCSGILKNKQGAVSIAVFHFLLDTEVVYYLRHIFWANEKTCEHRHFQKDGSADKLKFGSQDTK